MEHEHIEHESHEGHAETPWEIITDPPHFIAEMFFEGAFFIVSALWVRYKLRRRDKAHNHETTFK